MLAGIRDILIISTPEVLLNTKLSWAMGAGWVLSLAEVREKPEGCSSFYNRRNLLAQIKCA